MRGGHQGAVGIDLQVTAGFLARGAVHELELWLWASRGLYVADDLQPPAQ
jgi:hypothetical protein